MSAADDRAAAAAAAHDAAVAAGEPGYLDPETGYFVFTSAALAAKGKGSCKVSDARPYGAKTGAGAYMVEVACSDGGPGWVIELAPTSDTAVDLLNCAQAAKLGGGGCQLPTNKKG